MDAVAPARDGTNRGGEGSVGCGGGGEGGRRVRLGKGAGEGSGEGGGEESGSPRSSEERRGRGIGGRYIHDDDHAFT